MESVGSVKGGFFPPFFSPMVFRLIVYLIRLRAFVRDVLPIEFLLLIAAIGHRMALNRLMKVWRRLPAPFYVFSKVLFLCLSYVFGIVNAPQT